MEPRPAAVALPVTTLRERSSWLRALGRLARQKPLGTIGVVVILAIVVVAVFAPLIAPFDPLQMHIRDKLLSPSAKYWLGTDDIGRDVLSRTIWGARVSVFVGALSVLFGTAVGSLIGIISGYFEGKVDLIVQRVVDTLMALPGLVFLMVVVSVLGPGITNAILAISILMWPSASRVTRGAVLTLKRNAFIEAARAIGATDFRIVVRHILPNVMAPIIIIASVMLGSAILMEASLSFLGLGVKPPKPSWGGMLSVQGRAYMEQAPWLAVVPGISISLAVLSFNLLGDALRDVLDPRLKGT